ALHSASMFRRSAWTTLGAFDEALPTLEYYEFWLRLLHAGRRATVVEAPLLFRFVNNDGLYRRGWARQPHLDTMTRILARHATVFARDPVAALDARERTLLELGDRYRRLIAGRDAGLRELDAL